MLLVTAFEDLYQVGFGPVFSSEGGGSSLLPLGSACDGFRLISGSPDLVGGSPNVASW